MLRNYKDTDVKSGTDPQLPMNSFSKTKIQETHLVTGGGGYAGFWLGKRLAGRGHRVILVDVRAPVWSMMPGMEFQEVNVEIVYFVLLL